MPVKLPGIIRKLVNKGWADRFPVRVSVLDQGLGATLSRRLESLHHLLTALNPATGRSAPEPIWQVRTVLAYLRKCASCLPNRVRAAPGIDGPGR
jgi:hypothetical protein